MSKALSMQLWLAKNGSVWARVATDDNDDDDGDDGDDGNRLQQT